MSTAPIESNPELARRAWFTPRSFRTKFVLVVGAALIVNLILGGSVALWNVNRLGQDASTEIQHGLEKASKEYLENYIQTTALRANLLLGQVNSEVTSLAGSMQTLIDQPDAQQNIGGAISDVPYFSRRFEYNEKGNWVQNGGDDPSVISIWGYLLGLDKKPRPDVLDEVRQTAIFDLIGTSAMRTGAQKLQVYYIGPKERPIFRTTPYSDQAQTFDKLYPGHNDKNFWDFFFPGVYEAWQTWVRDPKSRLSESYITSTAPYIDAITGNLIVSFFHPLWTKDRNDCAGAVGADISLQQLSGLITNVHVAETGFAFLSLSNGNLLAVNAQGERALGIETRNAGTSQGVTALDRNLKKSQHPEVASLALPTTDAIAIKHIQLPAGDPNDPTDPTGRYVVVLRRLSEMNVWADGKISRDFATLGFMVPEREIYATLFAAQSKVAKATSNIRDGQLAVLCFSLGLVLVAVLGISRRITAGISNLAMAARRIENKDYSVRVSIPTNDEVGALGHAFNKMTEEIETYTATLEDKVEERTEKLAAANREIQALNELLAGENVRMGAELNVARRMQMMVLPKPDELRTVPAVDIAAYMEPASEVGGDYYDVLQLGSRVKIGIGDVTGHGFESGVLMLMVQSVARTLHESGESDPKRFLAVLNQVICKNLKRTESNNNLTLAFIDVEAGALTLTGQHEEAIVVRANGSTERIDTIDLGFPIGLEEDIFGFVQSRRIAFAEGDMVILYTDGITEAEGPTGELYGIERLCEAARRAHAGTAEEVQRAVIADVTSHIATQKIHDDITLVVLKHT